MPSIGRSGKLYQERRQPEFQATLRGPGPQIYLPDNLIHSLPLEPPFPHPQYQHRNNGAPVPDAGRTQAWPHGDKYADGQRVTLQNKSPTSKNLDGGSF